ncbi:GNAT family N-acetyltransferase [Acuticoccus yangtzensis]|uniref:GNAT family N-acetyltransferase n=1 Tax=Acuticoccus yangtzensis TaxID=1443441 RepID=UPI00094979BB|nr:GNAT family N-acetyltransferase [Acuticoccus yangtzensis]
MPIDMSAIPAECIVKQGDDWMLVSPIPDFIAGEVAAYSAAQRATLKHIVGPEEMRRKVVGNRMRQDRLCVAIVKGEIAGCISYRMDGEGSVWPDPKRFREVFGPVGGTVRYLLAEATLRRGTPEELYLEGFKVDPAARGRGIGTSLLHWLGAEVVRRGKARWRTEASVTAAPAMRVYQGVGAKPTKTVNLGPIGRIADRPKFTVLVWEPPVSEGKDETAL